MVIYNDENTYDFFALSRLTHLTENRALTESTWCITHFPAEMWNVDVSKAFTQCLMMHEFPSSIDRWASLDIFQCSPDISSSSQSILFGIIDIKMHNFSLKVII